MRSIQAFISDGSGATAIEYALLSSLIALALVAVLTSTGLQLSASYSEISSALK